VPGQTGKRICTTCGEERYCGLRWVMQACERGRWNGIATDKQVINKSPTLTEKEHCHGKRGSSNCCSIIAPHTGQATASGEPFAILSLDRKLTQLLSWAHSWCANFP